MQSLFNIGAPAVCALLALGAGLALAADETNAVHRVEEGFEWVRFENAHDIVAGSALDFSGFGLHDAPAGKYGWVRSDGQRAVFERRPGVPARFYGVNLCNDANYLDDEQIERVTDRLVRLGYNAIRVHHHDEMWARDEGGARERLDRLVAACVRKGIYVMTDLYVSRAVSWRELGVDREGMVDEGFEVKMRMMTTEAGFACWKKFATGFLTRVNPATGRALKDEPAMPFLVLINESSPHSHWTDAARIPEFRARWKTWLAEARAQSPNAYPTMSPDAFPESGSWWNLNAKANAMSSYWAWTLRRFADRATAFLKGELGVKALIATENNGPILPEISRTRADCGGFVDTHWYTEHANAASAKDRKAAGLPIVSTFRNHSPLKAETDAFCKAGFWRAWGRPMTVSESNMGGPNFNRAAHGLQIGSFASVQDWTGIWTFALAHHAVKLFDGCRAAPGRFDLSLDPLLQAADRMAILLFLRGDLPTPAAAFANVLSADDLSPASRDTLLATPAWGGEADPGLAWRARLGLAFGSAPAGVVGRGPQDAPLAADEEPPGVGVKVNREKGEMSVAARRFAGGAADAGSYILAGPLVARVAGSRACVAAASLTDDALPRASRILLWHLTDLHGEGFSWGGRIPWYGGESLTGVVSWGTGKRLFARAGVADVALRLERPEEYAVWALDAVGNRMERIPTRIRDGRLVMSLGIRPGAPARFYYEVVRLVGENDIMLRP